MEDFSLDMNFSLENSTWNETSIQGMGIPAVDMAIAVECMLIGFLGIVINGCIFLIIFSNLELRRKDYICFIANRTMTDCLYCFCLMTIQPISILLYDPLSEMCITAGFSEVILASATMYAEPFLAANRYVSIHFSDLYKRLFTRRNVLLMCGSVWLLGLGSSLPHVFANTLCRMPGMVCALCLHPESLLVVIFSNFLFMFIGLGLIGYFNYHIYQSLNKHQKQTLTNSQQSKLQKDKEMLYFIIASALTPVILETPVIAGDWIRMYRMDWAPDWAMCAAMMVFNLTPMINAIITLAMVRPIKREFTRWMAKLRGEDVANAPQFARTVVTVQEPTVARPKDA